jgi:ABC-type bacteriocin/lantibiotic exporter with double-glycine peptidase domain
VIFFACMMPMILIFRCFSPMLRRLKEEKQTAIADINTHAQESISNIRTVKTFSNESFDLTKLHTLVEK